MRIYLSGPITGATEGAIASWRERVLELLPSHVEVFDPALSIYDSDSTYTQHESSADALMRLRHGLLVIDRNKHAIQSSDVVLANFLEVDHASIGSIGELFWANAFRIPIVIVREPTGNVHDHAMLNGVASIITHNVEDGCRAALSMLEADIRIGRSKG